MNEHTPNGVSSEVATASEPITTETSGNFSSELLARQLEIAARLDEITSDPKTLATAERFHKKVTHISVEDLLRQLT